MMQGLPLNQFLPGSLKEGSSVTAYNGTLSLFNRAPHPNAAKVAVNWLLSQKGQTAWLDYNQKPEDSTIPLREDISKEKVSERARRVKGAKFSLVKSRMDRRARYDSRHNQKIITGRRQSKIGRGG